MTTHETKRRWHEAFDPTRDCHESLEKYVESSNEVPKTQKLNPEYRNLHAPLAETSFPRYNAFKGPEEDAISHAFDPVQGSLPGEVNETNARPILRPTSEEITKVCYGTLCDIMAQFYRVAGYKTPQKPTQTVVRLSVVRLQDHYVIKTRNGVGIGTLSKNFSSYINELKKVAAVRLEAVVDDVEVAKWLDKSKESSNCSGLSIEINVYGNSNSSRIVAETLSNQGLFLQDPIVCEDGVLYQNPQWIKFPDLREEDMEDKPFEIMKNLNNDQAQTSLKSVLDYLPEYDFLQEMEIDVHVTTQLRTHQKEAVDFIIRRENGNLPATLDLWRYREANDGSNYYHHAILDVNSPNKPDDIHGGILADEMGLGKSLIMLAAIVASLQRAATFGERRELSKTPTEENKMRSKATLIVVPSAMILEGWLDQIARHLSKDTLRVHKYHGQIKEIDHVRLRNFDVVLTTYDTVATDTHRGRRFFQTVEWFRIVLDEAHTIRTQSTKKCTAISALSADIRWCLTGTPIQNRLEDLGALTKFLRVPLLQESSKFKNFIIMNTLEKAQDRFSNLRLLLSAYCLRRTRESLGLPEAESETQYLEFSAAEREGYEAIGHDFKRDVQISVSEGNIAAARSSVLKAILRLRSFCNTGPSISSTQIQGEPSKSQDPHNTSLMCAGSTSASHPSTKLKAILDETLKSEPGTKSIVFTYWKETLNLVEALFNRNSIRSYRIDGSMSVFERKKALVNFQRGQQDSVLLMTLSAGAEGLNIESANRIHIVEPQWNPAAESQAIGRAVRLDQAKEVTVVRYIMKKSVEETNVLALQNRKLDLASGGFEDQVKKLSENEILETMDLMCSMTNA